MLKVHILVTRLILSKFISCPFMKHNQSNVTLSRSDINHVSQSIAKYTSKLISDADLEKQKDLIKATYHATKKKLNMKKENYFCFLHRILKHTYVLSCSLFVLYIIIIRLLIFSKSLKRSIKIYEN